MWGKKKGVAAVLIFAIIGSFGFCGWLFLQLGHSHQLLHHYLIPQKNALVEMERALTSRDSVSYIEARSRFLEFIEPAASVSFIETIASLEANPELIRDQILPQIERRMTQTEQSEQLFLRELRDGLIFTAGLISLAFIGWVFWAWSLRRKTEALEQDLANQLQLADEKLDIVFQKSQELLSGVDEVRIPLGQIKGTVGLAGDQTGIAARGAEEITEQVKQNQEKLAAVLSMIRVLAGDTERMRVLAEGLSDLADQANLFLVNASIEVARQRETGRGFSEVAQEVSSLAEGSGKASVELNQLIHQIHQQATQVLQTLEKETSSFAETHQLTARTRQSFEELSQMISHLSAQTARTENGFGELLLRIRSIGALMK